MLTAVSAFQRRASALLLPHRGAGTMSLANLSRIESMIGQRQDWPFGLSWAARLDRSAAAVLQCPKRRESRAGRDIPARLVLSHPAGFGLDILADRTMTRIATGSITDIQSTAGRLTAADLLAGHHSFLQKSGAHRSQPAR